MAANSDVCMIKIAGLDAIERGDYETARRMENTLRAIGRNDIAEEIYAAGCAQGSATHCTTCGWPADKPYSSEQRGELCCDPIHTPFYSPAQRAHFERFQERYSAQLERRPRFERIARDPGEIRAQLGAGADYVRGSEQLAARI